MKAAGMASQRTTVSLAVSQIFVLRAKNMQFPKAMIAVGSLAVDVPGEVLLRTLLPMHIVVRSAMLIIDDH